MLLFKILCKSKTAYYRVRVPTCFMEGNIPQQTLPAEQAVLQPEIEQVAIEVTQEISDHFAWAKLKVGDRITQELYIKIQATKICGRCRKQKEDCYCGRPTKYDPVETITESLNYLESCEDAWEKVPSIVHEQILTKQIKDEEGNETGEEEISKKETVDYVMKRTVKLPSIEGLAYFLGVTRPLIYEWKQLYPEFLYIIEKLQTKQTRTLIDKGVSGDYNSTISKVLLAKQGYKEETSLDLSSKDGSMGNLNQEQRSILDKLLTKPETHAEQTSTTEGDNGNG